MRPKSIATVVVVLAATPSRSSTPTLASVSASSVRSGRISLTAPTSVVFPTPNPPATRIFSATRGPSSRSSAGSAAAGGGESECTEFIEHHPEQVLVGVRGDRRRLPGRRGRRGPPLDVHEARVD